MKGTWLIELNYSEVKWRFQPKSGKDFHGETLPIKKESYKKVEIEIERQLSYKFGKG